jgi:hypothetical protein
MTHAITIVYKLGAGDEHNKGFTGAKFWLAAVLLGCILASTTVAAPTAKRSAAAKSGIVPDPLVFVKQVEPNEKAFTILVPKGWICEGGSFLWTATRSMAGRIQSRRNSIMWSKKIRPEPSCCTGCPITTIAMVAIQ